MRIGIDATSILYGTGVSFYTSNLLRALSRIDKNNEYVVFGSTLRGRTFLEKKISKLDLGKNFSFKTTSFPPSFLEIMWHKARFLPIEKFVGPVDVFHAWDWLMPVCKKAKIVTTIHDLAVVKFPQYFPQKILKVQRERLELVKMYADAVVAVSKNTKKDIVKFLKIAEEKIQVIYEAVPIEHQLKPSKKNIKELKEKYSLKDYILCVGTREPRKNLQGAIKAHNILISQYPNIELIIVGKKGWGKDIKKLKIQNEKLKIKFIEKAGDKELAALYAGAKCFVYPSFYEGFGLPVLEAMNQGCPVITSNVSSLPEVAGSAAILINPNKVDEIVNSIKKIFQSEKIRKDLVKKGFQQVKKFSWNKTAEETLRVYYKLNPKGLARC